MLKGERLVNSKFFIFQLKPYLLALFSPKPLHEQAHTRGHTLLISVYLGLNKQVQSVTELQLWFPVSLSASSSSHSNQALYSWEPRNKPPRREPFLPVAPRDKKSSTWTPNVQKTSGLCFTQTKSHVYMQTLPCGWNMRVWLYPTNVTLRNMEWGWVRSHPP